MCNVQLSMENVDLIKGPEKNPPTPNHYHFCTLVMQTDTNLRQCWNSSCFESQDSGTKKDLDALVIGLI